MPANYLDTAKGMTTSNKPLTSTCFAPRPAVQKRDAPAREDPTGAGLPAVRQSRHGRLLHRAQHPGEAGRLAVWGRRKRQQHDEHYGLPGRQQVRPGDQPSAAEERRAPSVVVSDARLPDAPHGHRLLRAAHHRHQVRQAVHRGESAARWWATV